MTFVRKLTALAALPALCVLAAPFAAASSAPVWLQAAIALAGLASLGAVLVLLHRAYRVPLMSLRHALERALADKPGTPPETVHTQALQPPPALPDGAAAEVDAIAQLYARLLERTRAQLDASERQLYLVGDGLGDEMRQRATLEMELTAERRQLSLLQEQIDAAVWGLSPSGQPLWFNRAARELTECDSLSELRLHKRLFLHPAHELLTELVRQATESKTGVELPAGALLARGAGRHAVVSGSLSPVLGERGALQGFLLVLQDTTRQNEAQRALEWQVRHDSLTGLPNRQQLEQALQALHDAGDAGAQPHGLLLIEIDHLAIINGACGYATGDALLQQLSQELRGWMRPSDVLSRVCGNRLALLLHRSDAQLAQDVAQEIIATARDRAFSWDERSFHLSLSIGVVAVRAPQSPQRTLSTAETACQLAKTSPQNRMHLYNEDRDDAYLLQRHHQNSLAADLPRLAREQRLLLYQQEIRPLAGNEPKPRARFEVLLRLRDGDDALRNPADLLASAQRYALSPIIDRWVVASAIEAIVEQKLAAPSGAAVCHINLAPATLAEASFARFVLQELAVAQCPPQSLCFELTGPVEHADAHANVQALHAAGVEFALDDFGASAFALGELRRLPLGFVKLDGALWRDFGRSALDEHIVTAICQLCHRAGIRVVAEQVESLDVLHALQRLGVDYAQGAVFMPAQPLQQIDLSTTQRLSLQLQSQYHLPSEPPGVALH